MTAGGAPLDIARDALRHGWSPLPIPYKSKQPGFKDWLTFRVSDETIGQHFNGAPMNIGVILGEASHGLGDVDIDWPEYRELAERFLPATDAVFGRGGAPRTHRLYTITP